MGLRTNALMVLDDTIKTIATGAITITQTYHAVAAESGTTDDLATINVDASVATSDGANTFRPFVILRADTGDTITVKHGTGNISLNGAADFSLSGNKQLLLLYDGTNWTDLGAGGSGGGSFTDFTLAADSGTPETVADGNTVTIAGGTGIDTSVAATDTVTIAIDSSVATLTGAQTLANKILSQLHLLLGGFKAIFTHSNTADRTYTLPDYDGTLATRAGTETFTNKTIDADGTGNVITNIGSSEVKAELITGLTADASPDGAADYVMTYDNSATALKKVLLNNLPSSGISKVVATGSYSPGANITTNSTSMVDVDAANVKQTVTLNGGGVTIVTFTFDANKATAGNMFFRVTDGTNNSTEVGFRFLTSHDYSVTVVAIFDGLSAGSTTFKLQFRSSDANNVQIITPLPITWYVCEVS